MESTNGFYFPFERDVNMFFQDNHAAMALLAIIVFGYVARYAPPLPRAVDNAMHNMVAQFVFFFLVAYLTSTRLVISAAVSAGVILVLYLLERYVTPSMHASEEEESKPSSMLPYHPEQEIANLMNNGMPNPLPTPEEQPIQQVQPNQMPAPQSPVDSPAVPAGYEGFGQYAYVQ